MQHQSALQRQTNELQKARDQHAQEKAALEGQLQNAQVENQRLHSQLEMLVAELEKRQVCLLVPSTNSSY